MASPTAVATAKKLRLPKLKTKILETYFRQGGAALFGRFPFMTSDEDEIKLIFEKTLPTGASDVDPLTTSIPGGGEDYDELSVEWRTYSRCADTANRDKLGKSKYINQKRQRIAIEQKKMIFDFMHDTINGLGRKHNGLEAGSGGAYSSTPLQGLEWWVNYMADNYNADLVKYHTSDGTPTGTKTAFSFDVLDALKLETRCGDYGGFYMDKETHLMLKSLLNAVGGQTAPMLMSEDFGMSFYSHGQYDGIPTFYNVDLGAARTGVVREALSATDTVVLLGGDAFKGITKLYVGASFECALDVGTHTTTIAAVETSSLDAEQYFEITLADAIPASRSVAAGTPFTIGAVKVCYAIRFGEDGVSFEYGAQDGSSPDSRYPCLPSVVGFVEKQIGELEDSMIDRTRLEWHGALVSNQTDAIARVSHYDVLA